MAIFLFRYTEGLKLLRADNEQTVPLLASEVRKLDAGLRTSEVYQLRPADVIFSSNSLVVNCSKEDKSRIVHHVIHAIRLMI